MKRNTLLLIMAMIEISLQCMGQPRFIKYVHITTENVNMRKAPSTNSAKLMETWDEGEHIFVWSDTSVAQGTMPCYPQQDEVLGVVEQTGDWLKVLKNGMKCESGICTKEYAYIMAKFCEEVHPVETTPAMYNEYKSNTGYRMAYFTTGKYKGRLIAKFDRCAEDDSYGGLRLGRYKDGKLFFEQRVVMDILPDFSQAGIYLKPHAKYDIYAKELNYGTNYRVSQNDIDIDLKKLTDRDIELIFDNVISEKSLNSTLIFYTEEKLWAEIYW